MISCLNNRIGIAGCDAPSTEAVEASAPGVTPVVPAVEALPILLINDLPGCPLLKIDSLTDDERDTYLEVWNSIANRAIQKFMVLVKAEFNKCFQINDKTVLECLICENSDSFDVPLWYLHGTELMIELTSSDNLNRYTTIDLDKAERLKGEFYAEFQSFLSDAVSSIDTLNSDCITTCLEGNDSVRWVYQTPW
ncbi:MAG: hypothetical protein ABI237_05955 [Ginsengibacter sp.]